VSVRALAALVRFQSEVRRPLYDRDPVVMREAIALLAPPSSPKVARALVYLEQRPGASANDTVRYVGGRRADALAAIREAKAVLGTAGNQLPRHRSGGPKVGLSPPLRASLPQRGIT
jgi:hypothetical protein